ncbi:hypothetical protein [Sulfidibacter corallicola]|uniref:Uncharacterized protein n=1 Tax=Sulfidibacter corallicola TaxID=2818388 RepID=A0A8A4U5S2_SULCO|nr:hypothetical protein [Sulfidibacter corallicola]QTD54095.1 hypothetical protein J3U87_16740 [Sulfidibacter corallicola]
MNINVSQRYATGVYQRGTNIDTGKPRGQGLMANFSRTPKTLALFNHEGQNHISTGVSELQFGLLEMLDSVQNPSLDATNKQLVKDILNTAGVDFSEMNQRTQLKAAVMLGRGEVSGAWLAQNTNAVSRDDADAIAVGKMLQKDYAFAHKQKMGGIQDPSDSFNTRLALDIADRVIGVDGNVDQNKLDTVIEQLQNDTLAATFGVGPHRQEMVKLLTHISNSGNFRNVLNGINAPNLNTPQERIVRATINKPTGNLTDRDARKAVLSAMLSHLRQGSVGSCFGTSIAIHLKTNHYDKTLNIMKSLVERGVVPAQFQKTPNTNQYNFDFPINDRVFDTQYDQNMSIKRNGIVTAVDGSGLDGNIKVKEIPGIVKALEAIGIQDADRQHNVLLAALRDLTSAIGSSEISPKTLLHQVIQKENVGNKAEAKKKAAFAFHASMENRLLRSFEYTLSGLAETRYKSMSLVSLGTKVTDTFAANNYMNLVVGAMQSVTDGTDQNTYANFASDFSVRLSELFDQNLILTYDPEFTQSKVADDGRSTHGGFTISFRNPTNNETVPVTSTRQLVDALRTMFTYQANQDLTAIQNAGYNNPQNVQAAHIQLTTALWNTINTDQFEQRFPNRLRHYQEDPLGFAKGSKSFTVMRMIFPNDSSITSDTKHRNNNHTGKDVLRLAIQSMRGIHQNMSDIHNNFQQRDLSQISVPASNGPHAFLIQPGLDPAFVDAWSGSESIDSWIEANLETFDVKNYEVTSLEKDQVDAVIEKVGPWYDIDVDAVKEALQDNDPIYPDDMYRALVDNMPQSPKKAQFEKELALDLVEAFDAPIGKVIFADTNWGNGDTQIHFGTAYNPFSQSTDLWEFKYDGSDWTPRSVSDQAQHVQTKWDIANDPHQFGF